MLTNREQYIKDTFFNHLPEKESVDIVKKISKIGESLGFVGTNVSQDKDKSEKRKHKYDVWISKEVKKDESIINKELDLRLIIDWAVETSADIFKFDFNSAFKAQTDWHEEMKAKLQIEKFDCPEVDENRVIFKFSDKNISYIFSQKKI